VAERPRTYKAEGIVLRRRNIGEADSVFTLFSPGEGKFEGVARGVRKARSHMRGHLEPLTHCRVMLARGRTLDVFTQAETVHAYQAIRDDLERSATALYCAELVDRFTVEHQEQAEVFTLLLETLDALEAGAPAMTARYFELRLLAISGYELQLEACAICNAVLPPEETLLSPPSGGLVCRQCRPAATSGRVLSLRAVKVLRFGRGAALAEFAAVRCDDALATELRVALSENVRYVLDRDVYAERFVAQVARLAPGGLRGSHANEPVE
jgi:DNA repair protein RecO (recombination protein O)